MTASERVGGWAGGRVGRWVVIAGCIDVCILSVLSITFRCHNMADVPACQGRHCIGAGLTLMMMYGSQVFRVVRTVILPSTRSSVHSRCYNRVQPDAGTPSSTWRAGLL